MLACAKFLGVLNMKKLLIFLFIALMIVPSIFAVYGSGDPNAQPGGDNNPPPSQPDTGGSDNDEIVSPVEQPAPAPAAPVTPTTAVQTPKKEVAKETTPASVAAETTTETPVKAERRETREAAKKVEKTARRDLAGKAFDQLFGSAGSCICSFNVLVLIGVVNAGVLYYKKKKK